MKKSIIKKRHQGIAERKTSTKKKRVIPYKNLGMGLILWLLTTWIFFGKGTAPTITETLGERAGATVVSKVEFQCENLRETALAKEEKRKSVPSVFTLDPQPQQKAIDKIQSIFTQLEQYVAAAPNDQTAKLNIMDALLQGSEIGIRAQEFVDTFPSNVITSVKEQLLTRIPEVMGKGILSDENRNDLSSKSLSIGPSRTVAIDELHSRDTAIATILVPYGGGAQRALLEKLLSSLIQKNLTYNAKATDDKKLEVAEKVAPVMEFHPEGEVLIRAGEQVTAQTELLLKTHALILEQQQEGTEQTLELIGKALLLLVALSCTAAMLRIVNPIIIRNLDKLLLFIILSAFTIGASRLVTYLSVSRSLLPPSTIMYMIPGSLAIMLCAILLGGSAAICLGFWTSFCVAILLENSFSAFALGMAVTVTAATATRKIHRRASLFRAGLWICVAKVLYVLLIALLENQHVSVVGRQLSAAVSAVAISSVLTLLLIPLFEKLFKITTDITLLELSDMGDPLLQKMAMQAPGTYHHSLMVATLAQNAAEAIGANALLARVCAYYHDIGKMAKPEFFTENIQHKENPHDELSPHMSALVISSHVKEGLALAKRNKLPQPILDAIEQHHGNGLISFFYYKAKKLAGNDSANMADLINESDFRYGGAPAVTPEMTILSLADASEAASRSIEKPTPQKIANLLDEIFTAKMRDGQLDHSDLTMAEITAIKQSFVFSLTNMLHGRIPYPKDNDNKHSKSAEKPSDSDTKPV